MQSACAICLQSIKNPAILDCCNHIFCKTCILTWLQKQPVCPLCKRKVNRVTADIVNSSQYTQFLPNGEYVYSDYDPNRRIIYTFKLEPLPDYSGEVHPSEANKCVILKEWTKREIETLQPGVDSDLFVSIVTEGLRRYSSRDPLFVKRIEELLEEESSIFLRELEACVHTRAKSLEECDSCMCYCYPSVAEKLGPFTGEIDYEQELSHLENDLYHLEKKMNILLEVDPTLGEARSNNSEDLEHQQETRKYHKKKHHRHHHRKKDSSVERLIYSDIETSELYEY